MGLKNILIDGTTISIKMDGLSQYILNVVRNINCRSANYTLIVRPNQCPQNFLIEFKSMGIEVLEVNIKPIGPIREFQFLFFLISHPNKFDIAFIPSNQFPIFINIPTVYTIHDLIYEQFPTQLGKYSKLKCIYLNLVVSVGIKKSKKVIAVSEFTKSEIMKIHKPRIPEKVEVVYEGWEHLKVIDRSKDFSKCFIKYILYVGSGRGHKNLSNLIEAIDHAKTRLPADWGFVIAGNTSQFSEIQKNRIKQINLSKEVIKLTGWLSDEALASYFSNADAFIFPSLSEGFGIPVLESFYYKVPILLSNRGSLPEVAGKAGLYFDPFDIQGISNTIINFITQEKNLTQSMINEGCKQLKLFSWKKTSEIISNILEN